MDGIRIRGARLVYRQRELEAVPVGRTGFAVRRVDVKPGHFFDGDVIEFLSDDDAQPYTKDSAFASDTGQERQCFRVGRGGSTLTPVARGSWL